MKKITAEELYKKMNSQEKMILLDVRAEDKFNDFHIEDANIKTINIPKTNIFGLTDNQADSISHLPKDKEIIVTCTTGNSATKCAKILSEREYNVTVLDGGITAWKQRCQTP